MLQIFYMAINQIESNLIAKYHIFLSWLNKASPGLEIFSLLLNEKILCEHKIAFKNNSLSGQNLEQNGQHCVHELPQISLSQRMCHFRLLQWATKVLRHLVVKFDF